MKALNISNAMTMKPNVHQIFKHVPGFSSDDNSHIDAYIIRVIKKLICEDKL